MIGSLLMMSLGLTVPSGPETSKGKPLESVEWLCSRADLVVVGRIVSATDLQGSGKSRGLMSFDLEGHNLAHPSTSGTYGIAIRDVSLETLNGLRDAKTELVVFLRRTEQSFHYGGQTMDIWPLRADAGGHWVAPINVPDTPLVSARSATVLADEANLAKVCAASMRPAGVPYYPEPPRAYLPVPADAPLVKALADRAPAHLVVPAAAFPSAVTTPPESP